MLLHDLCFCYPCADHVSTSVSFKIPKCITNFWPSRINDLLHHHNNLEFHNFTALTAFQLITKLNFNNASKLYPLTKFATACYIIDYYYYYYYYYYYFKNFILLKRLLGCNFFHIVHYTLPILSCLHIQ